MRDVFKGEIAVCGLIALIGSTTLPLTSSATSHLACSKRDAMLRQYWPQERLLTKTRYLPAIEILNDRGTYSASLGIPLVWSRPIVKHLPWFACGCWAVGNLVGVAVAAVEKCIQEPSNQTDLLARLQQETPRGNQWVMPN